MDIKCSTCKNEAEIFHGRRFCVYSVGIKLKKHYKTKSDNSYRYYTLNKLSITIAYNRGLDKLAINEWIFKGCHLNKDV